VDASPVIREPGIDAVVDGKEVRVDSHARAEREGLAGDPYNGWHGSASVTELTDVDERVSIGLAPAQRVAAMGLDNEERPFGVDPEHVDRGPVGHNR